MQQVSAMEFFAVCLVHGDYVLISSEYLNLNNFLLCFQSKPLIVHNLIWHLRPTPCECDTLGSVDRNKGPNIAINCDGIQLHCFIIISVLKDDVRDP